MKKILISSFFVLALIVPIGFLILNAFTDNMIVAKKSIGTYVSSTTSAGGFLSSGTTTINTTEGSFTIGNPISATKKQQVFLIKKIKDEQPMVCVGKELITCSYLFGKWSGKLTPVVYKLNSLDKLTKIFNSRVAGYWLFLGTTLSFCLGVILLVEMGE